jgi:hypothetical protein
MWQLLIGVATWFLHGAQLKFVLVTGIFFLVQFLWPLLLSLVGRFADTSSINSMLSGVPSGVWWLANLFRIDVGLSAAIAAFTTRFLIRRIPFIG